MDDLLAKDQGQDLQPGEGRSVFENAWVYGIWMRVVIVPSDLSVLDTLSTYQKKVGNARSQR